MNKTTILKRLKDAGIEADPNLSREDLIKLAAAKGVSLAGDPAGAPAPAGDTPPATGDTPPAGDAPADLAAGTPAGAPGPEADKFAKTAAAAEKLAEVLSPDPAPRFSEEQIQEKTRAGLSRAQAIEVLTSQAEHDARLGIEQGA